MRLTTGQNVIGIYIELFFLLSDKLDLFTATSNSFVCSCEPTLIVGLSTGLNVKC
jgi:hypothetical protein